MNIASHIDHTRIMVSKKLDSANRSALGQFMTPFHIAEYMASLFEYNCPNITLLDAGSGIGALSVSFMEQLINKNNFTALNLHSYEIEKQFINHLKENLDHYNDFFKKQNIVYEYDIKHLDFIKEATQLLSSHKNGIFTHAILNPPYKKINSQSEHSQLLRSAGLDAVNLYSAFISLAILLLKDQGELVAIIPRSFCNGAYYKGFRQLILKETAITHIHLFESRTKAFQDDSVLQENIIIKLTKGEPQKSITVSSSSDDSFSDYKTHAADFESVVKNNDPEFFIHIPSTKEIELNKSGKLIKFNDLGIKVSTGPIVDFRQKDAIHQVPIKDSVPLIYPEHFSLQGIEWPKLNSKKPNGILVTESTKNYLYECGYYVLVKRFSSKEEKRRIVARVLTPNITDQSFIGIENHLNVYHFNKKGLDKTIAYGLALFLNSTQVDDFFRVFSGHTQVNVTDLKNIPYPQPLILKELGKWFLEQSLQISQAEIDKKIGSIL